MGLQYYLNRFFPLSQSKFTPPPKVDEADLTVDLQLFSEIFIVRVFF